MNPAFGIENDTTITDRCYSCKTDLACVDIVRVYDMSALNCRRYLCIGCYTKKQCCICKKHYGEWGHNPEPVKKRGRCCNKCNEIMVIPARMEMLYIAKNSLDQKDYITDLS